MNKEAKAKELLVWYFRLASSGAFHFEGDNRAEVENIIDMIIGAAAKEAVDKLLPRIETLEAKLNGGEA
ncbi:MAG: hypothetical protein IPG51_00900 [Chloroflexi bacterium]|nr:hypothetical protein [Chloroflexota bacterium]